VIGTTDGGVLRYDQAAGTAEVSADITYDGIVLAVVGEVSGSDSITTKNFQEVYRDYGSQTTSVSIDLSTANNFEIIAESALSVSFVSPPTTGNRAFGFTLVVTDGAGDGVSSWTVSWPATVDWAGGVAPALTANGKDILVFYTYDGGGTYYGFISAANIS